MHVVEQPDPLYPQNQAKITTKISIGNKTFLLLTRSYAKCVMNFFFRRRLFCSRYLIEYFHLGPFFPIKIDKLNNKHGVHTKYETIFDSIHNSNKSNCKEFHFSNFKSSRSLQCATIQQNTPRLSQMDEMFQRKRKKSERKKKLRIKILYEKRCGRKTLQVAKYYIFQ